MIDRDLELLGVVKHLTNSMPAMVLHLIEQMRDGVLPADKLHELAGITRDLADALDRRADEIDPASTGDAAPRVVEGETTSALRHELRAEGSS